MNYDYSIHSDFLIHWTGKDIDSAYDQQWSDFDNSKTKKSWDVTDRYLKRLFDILEYGIWMTSDSEKESSFCINETPIFIPTTPRSCFTELKLSQSRQHARLYGRLGIGFKRPFVIWRQGRPVIYYGFHNGSSKDKFLEQCALDITKKELLNFFKPMSSGTKLNYDFYSESEWRILFTEELLTHGLIKDPRDSKNEKEYSYFQKLTYDEKTKLKYLIPLDKWFTIIIYPSHEVKDKAQKELQNKMRVLIDEIKKRPTNIQNTVENSDWPIELYLDAYKNF